MTAELKTIDDAWLGLDIYPNDLFPESIGPDERTDTAKKLIDAGYSSQIMFGHDWNSTLHMANQEFQRNRRLENPDSYLFITRRVIPKLMNMGVTEETINQIMVQNPRRFFDG